MKALWIIALIIFGMFAGYALLTTIRAPSPSNILVTAVAILIVIGIFWFSTKDGETRNKRSAVAFQPQYRN